MAGGTWDLQNKVRPGVYVNFKQTPEANVYTRSGVVALPLSLNWGAEHAVQEITPDTDTLPIFGQALEDIVPLREALKRASKVLAYRLNANTGVKATVTTGNLTVTAKYSGTIGNSLKVVIVSEGAGKFTVETYLETALVDSQAGKETVAALANNAYVTFSGNGVLAATAGATLVNGTTEAAVSGDHSAFRTALEAHVWNVVGVYDVTDAGIKAAYKAWVQELRDGQGVKVQMVAENYPTADYEGVISVKNGVILDDGTTINAQKAVAWVAGATAAAGTNNSLTYANYDGAIDVDTKYTNAQIEAAIQAGEMLFTAKDSKARVEYDINTLTTFTLDKNVLFSKNRPLRALDAFNNDVVNLAELYFIGKVSNNEDGRNILKNEIIKYVQGKVNTGTFQNFNGATDVTVAEGDAIDSVVVTALLQPVDSMDKIYVQVSVS